MTPVIVPAYKSNLALIHAFQRIVQHHYSLLVFGRLEVVIEIRACERLRGTPHRYPFDSPVALLQWLYSVSFLVPQVIPTSIDLRTQYGASPQDSEFLAETQPPWTHSVILGYSRHPADVLILCCIGPSKNGSVKTAVEQEPPHAFWETSSQCTSSYEHLFRSYLPLTSVFSAWTGCRDVSLVPEALHGTIGKRGTSHRPPVDLAPLAHFIVSKWCSRPRPTPSITVCHLAGEDVTKLIPV
ncbi:hypothetical protein NMY22_g4595 [Coprinellus aureogranulatus]|nr:hypothetical protein NMY22_g4595 [Coprinellus aureogranulatus]